MTSALVGGSGPSVQMRVMGVVRTGGEVAPGDTARVRLPATSLEVLPAL